MIILRGSTVNNGEGVEIELAAFCDCLVPRNKGQADPSCSLCKGMGQYITRDGKALLEFLKLAEVIS